MQVVRRRDQRLNVIVKCPRNTEGSMQEGGGHWCESLMLPDHCLVAVWIPKGLSPKARLSNQEFPDSWGQVEKMSCQLLQEHEAAPHPPVASLPAHNFVSTVPPAPAFIGSLCSGEFTREKVGGGRGMACHTILVISFQIHH